MKCKFKFTKGRKGHFPTPSTSNKGECVCGGWEFTSNHKTRDELEQLWEEEHNTPIEEKECIFCGGCFEGREDACFSCELESSETRIIQADEEMRLKP